MKMRLVVLLAIFALLLAPSSQAAVQNKLQRVDMRRVVPRPNAPQHGDFVTEFQDTYDSGALWHDVTNQRVRTDFHEEGRTLLEFCSPERSVRYELKKTAGGGTEDCTFTNISCSVEPFSVPSAAEYFAFATPSAQSDSAPSFAGVWRSTYLAPSAELGVAEHIAEFYFTDAGLPSHYATFIRNLAPPGIKQLAYSFQFIDFAAETPTDEAFALPPDADCRWVDPTSCPFANSGVPGMFVEQRHDDDDLLSQFGVR